MVAYLYVCERECLQVLLITLYSDTVIVETVRFLEVDNVKTIWYTGLHSIHFEVEPLHVPLGV